ncbi:Predicted arabinose efflux permease, MFS family [Celeribacter baekdonensis]|uniref:Predicted arabinose efflux permease, MFS family n=1 Tax=Celeribacter baekdonensis TaxID=875171 RepID=A0A1G7UUT4_9RHOB|nr:MFS transporter [Celeribacter baekdonensis]SDG51041.1 Predicted arabinose efflux permease, MFS family [Celeribacter baekdonensis]
MKILESSEQKAAQRGVMLCLSLSMVLASLRTSIANIALPTLALAFDVPFHWVQWVVIAYLVSITLFVVIAGRLGDVFGRRRMLVLGLVVFSLASGLCGLASSLWMLVAARALQGIGAAFLMTLTIALVRETVGTERVGQAMGLLGTMSAVGTALGPSLGGVLIGAVGWPAIFLVLVPVGLLAAGLALRFLPAVAPLEKTPRLNVSALGKSGVLPGLAANLLVANVMMATLVVGPFYLAVALGLQEAVVGLVMSVGPVLSICTGVPLGRLVDRWGTRRVLTLGLGTVAAGALSLSVLPATFGVVGYIAAIAILTPGYQMFQSANNVMVMADVSANQRGAVSGLLGLSRNIGLISGASVMGAVFSAGVGSVAIEDAASGAIVDGLQITFLLGGLSILVALWFTRRLASDHA